MNPAPMMPSVATGLGSGAGDATPESFFSAVVAKKRKTSCCETSDTAISPKARASSR